MWQVGTAWHWVGRGARRMAGPSCPPEILSGSLVPSSATAGCVIRAGDVPCLGICKVDKMGSRALLALTLVCGLARLC